MYELTQLLDNWPFLLNPSRRKKAANTPSKATEFRTEIERDYDRILFSAPVRRMADKTQVFPLDRNDSVRNRLTHSHEVSNLARSFGTTIAHNLKIGHSVESSLRDIPSLLAAVGLVHDLGNPPFGHQGESAIQRWFERNKERILGGGRESLSENQFKDFSHFEGNAQTFRLVTRLQLLNDDYGLDLTYATLAAMMKYPVGSSRVNKLHISSKKHGFFASEENIAINVLTNVGLDIGKRHPLAYVMEACDDIAYAVLDIEDAVKKGLASFSDLMAFLGHRAKDDIIVHRVIKNSTEKNSEYLKHELSPAELNDISMQRFRVYAIGEMMNSCIQAFKNNLSEFTEGTQPKALLELSTSHNLREALGEFSKRYAFQHKTVLEIELIGYNTIQQLMDIFWQAIEATNPETGHSTPEHPYDKYIYTRISENYRRAYNKPPEELQDFPLRYRQCLLLTDMISGMTDSYAINLLKELQSYKATT